MLASLAAQLKYARKVRGPSSRAIQSQAAGTFAPSFPLSRSAFHPVTIQTDQSHVTPQAGRQDEING